MSLTLLEFCKLTNRTVADVARKADLDDKWLYAVAKGQRGFSPETADKIEKATEGAVTPSDLTRVRVAFLEAKKAARLASERAEGGKGSTPPFDRSAGAEAA